jgi:hypothetical protein
MILANVFWLGCTTISAPVKEYNLAMVALQSAKKARAPQWASGFYHQAEEACRRGQIFFQDRLYAEAKREFELCREKGEKAENTARLEQWKQGEPF